MAKLPTFEEMAQEVARLAVDECEYEGKTLREWIEIIKAQHGTNLAEVGTDLISRQALLDKFEPWLKVKDYNDGELNMLKAILYEIRFMRSAQPEIIRCKDCKYAEYIDDVQTLWCTECGQGRTVAPDDFCSYGERKDNG